MRHRHFPSILGPMLSYTFCETADTAGTVAT